MPPQKPLRLWPGVVLALLFVPLRLLVPFVVPEGDMIATIAGAGLGRRLGPPDPFSPASISRTGRASGKAVATFARLPALEGKTRNHPVIVRDVLLLRNGEEMAAFRLPALNR